MENNFLSMVNDAAILNSYLYLDKSVIPQNGEAFFDMLLKLYYNRKRNVPKTWSSSANARLEKILLYLERNKNLASAKLINQFCTEEGLCACAFSLPNGIIHVSFRGTGSGEWIDNGDGLSGISEDGDFATEQQAEALRWFGSLLTVNDLTPENIVLSGHSKGGNKAQFISLFHDVFSCISFDGQGFSPEAISYFENKLNSNFPARCKRIFNFSAENDYINVFGASIVPKENSFYLKSNGGYHSLDAILNEDGTLTEFSEKGKLATFAEGVSKELMALKPSIRKLATLGVMNVFQKYIADEESVTEQQVSLEDTLAGLGVATFSVLKSFLKK